MKSWYVRVIVGAILTLLLQTAALAITVIVNDQPLPPYPPPLQRQGRVMLPMRMVFEALGAEVKWEAVTRTAIGIRGDITVRMSINSNIASINDRPVTLDVPPQLIGGNTYMPVRFPAEAFGADVGWHGPTQTVTIGLPPLAQAQPPMPPEPPPPPPEPPRPPQPLPTQPQPGTVTGVVSAAWGSQLVLLVDEEIQVFNISSATIILRNNQQAPLGDLHSGDQAQVGHDGQGNAVLVRASYEAAEGIVLAKVPNQILLDTRPEPLQVQPQVEVVTSEGQESRYAEITNGDRVVAHITPGTNKVFRIVIQQPAAPPVQPPPPAVAEKPVIVQFYHDVAQPLRSGHVLRVTLEGTPHGTATFDIGDVVRDIPMTESPQRPGRYDASYPIPTQLNVLGVPLVGHLTAAGQPADPAQSAEPVTIDTVPPEVTLFGPEHNERTTNRRPNIAVLISDENGSGVDFDRCTATLRAGAQDHPVQVTHQGQLLTVAVAVPLPRARVTVTIEAYDLAGNLTQLVRSFNVVSPGEAAQEVSASHDAIGVVLMPGSQLTVTANGPADAAAASFDVGQWQQGLALQQLPAEPGTYQGTFIVPELAEDREETLTVRLRTADGEDLVAEAPTTVRFGPYRILKPQLNSPTEGGQVGEEVVIEGTTQPFAEVTCAITWAGELWILPVGGQVAEDRLTADELGHFQSEPISLELDSIAKDIRYTVTCAAKSPQGEESEPTVVEFTQ